MPAIRLETIVGQRRRCGRETWLTPFPPSLFSQTRALTAANSGTTLGSATITRLLAKAHANELRPRIWYCGLSNADLHIARVRAREITRVFTIVLVR
jgi:hypothetical protein